MLNSISALSPPIREQQKTLVYNVTSDPIADKLADPSLDATIRAELQRDFEAARKHDRETYDFRLFQIVKPVNEAVDGLIDHLMKTFPEPNDPSQKEEITAVLKTRAAFVPEDLVSMSDATVRIMAMRHVLVFSRAPFSSANSPAFEEFASAHVDMLR